MAEGLDLVSLGVGALTATASGSMQGPFKTLEDLWFITFGYKIAAKRQEIENNYLKNSEDLQNDIINELKNIQPDNLQEPKISILGPALEASKFYIDEDVIRKLFAKLIASSMDSSRNDATHHAFVEIIKMLSPLDARNLYYLHTTYDRSLTRLISREEIGDKVTVFCNHLYLGNNETQDYKLIEASIDNLIRLGLVRVTFEKYDSNDAVYEKHRNSKAFQALADDTQIWVSGYLKAISEIDEGGMYIMPEGEKLNSEDTSKYRQKYVEGASAYPDIEKGIIELTKLGKNFCEICLPTC